jgi:cyclin D7
MEDDDDTAASLLYCDEDPLLVSTPPRPAAAAAADGGGGVMPPLPEPVAAAAEAEGEEEEEEEVVALLEHMMGRQGCYAPSRGYLDHLQLHDEQGAAAAAAGVAAARSRGVHYIVYVIITCYISSLISFFLWMHIYLYSMLSSLFNYPLINKYITSCFIIISF